jgi:hypothetical protein
LVQLNLCFKSVLSEGIVEDDLQAETVEVSQPKWCCTEDSTTTMATTRMGQGIESRE